MGVRPEGPFYPRTLIFQHMAKPPLLLHVALTAAHYHCKQFACVIKDEKSRKEVHSSMQGTKKPVLLAQTTPCCAVYSGATVGSCCQSLTTTKNKLIYSRAMYRRLWPPVVHLVAGGLRRLWGGLREPTPLEKVGNLAAMAQLDNAKHLAHLRV